MVWARYCVVYVLADPDRVRGGGAWAIKAVAFCGCGAGMIWVMLQRVVKLGSLAYDSDY